MSRYILSPHEQGTDAWKLARCGRVTGSRVAAMLATTAKGWSTKRGDYLMELAVEKLTGEPAADVFVAQEMQHGIDNEPLARMAYEQVSGNIALESGFMYLPDVDVGCSVDGFFEEDGRTGVLEIKAPKSTNHIKYLQGQVVPDQYRPQCLHNVWVTGAEFADFVSFDPRFPEDLQLFVCRYTPTAEELAAHEKAVLQFLAERDELVAQLKRLAA